MSNSIENALKFLNTLEKLSGVSVATDNAVSICQIITPIQLAMDFK